MENINEKEIAKSLRREAIKKIGDYLNKVDLGWLVYI